MSTHADDLPVTFFFLLGVKLGTTSNSDRGDRVTGVILAVGGGVESLAVGRAGVGRGEGPVVGRGGGSAVSRGGGTAVGRGGGTAVGGGSVAASFTESQAPEK